MSRAALQHAPQPSGKSAAATQLRIGPAHDTFEQEAEQAAEKAVSGEHRHVAWSLSRIGFGPLQRQCSCGGTCDDCKRKKQVLQRNAASSVAVGSYAPASVSNTLSRPGYMLDPGTRSFMESRFGQDFSSVRIHTGDYASASARDVSARAYTVGSSIVFDQGKYQPYTPSGRRLLAHELAHVVQQAGGSPNTPRAQVHAPAISSLKRSGSVGVVQRYEAGEHAQFGETGDTLNQMTPTKALDYKVKPGETPEKLAHKFQVSVADLLAANPDKVKHWRLKNPDRIRDGFFAGDTIAIPANVNPALKEALKTKEISLTVNNAPLEYGDVIAMGDFYESAAQMLAAPEAELRELSRLIKLEKEGKGVPENQRDAQWNQVTHGRYGKLALDNEKHFAPSNTAFAPDSHRSKGDHKSEWETNHKVAVETSQSGDKDKALATNGFADHFLTDAFSAGHLFNKQDAMAKFESNLPKAKGEFTAPSKAFFDGIANKAFSGDVKTEFSALRTVACFNVSHEEAPCSNVFSGHGVIDTVDNFSSLLQGIQKKKPELMGSAVAKSAHDKLNTLPGGLPVENNMGDQWQLSGDKTLNAETTTVAKKAVAQSQINVLSNFKVAGPMDFPALFKRVWDFVPHPRKGAGEATVIDTLAQGTDPTKPGITDTVVKLIRDNLHDIVDGLKSMKILEPK